MHVFIRYISLFAILLSTLSSPSSYAASSTELVADSSAVLTTFHNYDRVKPFFDNAYGYAVFPSVGKGGFWIGGAYGNGLVYRENKVIAQTKLMQISLGFTFGGQAFSEILFFEDKSTFNTFMSGSFELGAQVSAIALTEGAAAYVGTTGASANASNEQSKAYYVNGIAIFTQAKGGLMIEAALAGQRFTIDKF